jgi:hypothetical protein
MVTKNPGGFCSDTPGGRTQDVFDLRRGRPGESRTASLDHSAIVSFEGRRLVLGGRGRRNYIPGSGSVGNLDGWMAGGQEGLRNLSDQSRCSSHLIHITVVESPPRHVIAAVFLA